MTDKILYVALDYSTPQQALSMARELNEVEVTDNVGYGYKLNGDLLLKYGLEVIDRFKNLNRPIFADLKLWKGRSTMTNIVSYLAKKGVELTNVYAHAGQEYLRPLVEEVKGNRLQLLALTVLTHYDEQDCQRLYSKSLTDTVMTFARIAHNSGCDGIIVPPTTLKIVKSNDRKLFTDLDKITPGIRPQWYQDKHDNYQKQVKTPQEAISAGADGLVMGSPIRKADSPKKALRKTLDEMETTLAED